MRPVVIVDTESTGLNPELHELWEFGAIEYSAEGRPEHQYAFHPKHLGTGDGQGVAVGGFYERGSGLAVSGYGQAVNLAAPGSESRWSDPGAAALAIARLLSRATVICAVPTHDIPFLNEFLRENDHAGGWHFRVRDFGSMAWGWLMAHDPGAGGAERMPMDASTDDFAFALGVDVSAFERHSALGDCRLLAACLDVMTGAKQ